MTFQLIDEEGQPAGQEHLDQQRLLAGYRQMVIGRRFDAQATSLARQGRLAVYPSAHGQEACEVGAVMALRPTDWLFPTYRDTMALVTRGIDAVEALTLMRGDGHCGYDPARWRTAPQCTPLATQVPHAAGLAMAARRRGDDVVALAICGDGGTSEGDFHEALNFAAVFQAPAVFLVVNNHYAISVPLSRQTRAMTLADKAAGYGMPGERVDGNDLAAVDHILSAAVGRARAGQGPTLVEAVTYRIQAHTTADDDSRYRDRDEVARWSGRDPIGRLESYLTATGTLDDLVRRRIGHEAEALARRLRSELSAEPQIEPPDLVAHVYASPTPQLLEQAAALTGDKP
jgi:pyruvate dehydrogenase E1 component alpha subunit